VTGATGYLVAIAREKGFVAYVGEGQNQWPAAHVSVASLVVVALSRQRDAQSFQSRAVRADSAHRAP
jgi:hypothetical protein